MKAVLVTLRIPIADEATEEDAAVIGKLVLNQTSRPPFALQDASIDEVELLDDAGKLGLARARALLREGRLTE